MKYSMPPVINDNCKILILDSLPGEKSLQLQEYYAHPQNQFWRIICSILNEPMPNSYDYYFPTTFLFGTLCIVLSVRTHLLIAK